MLPPVRAHPGTPGKFLLTQKFNKGRTPQIVDRSLGDIRAKFSYSNRIELFSKESSIKLKIQDFKWESEVAC